MQLQFFLCCLHAEVVVANQLAQKANVIDGKRMGSTKKALAAEVQVAEKLKLERVK